MRWDDLVSVFVDNMEFTLRDWLKASFSSCGTVMDVFIPASRRGRVLCFGFVRFWDKRQAVRFLVVMNGSRGWQRENQVVRR